MEDRAPLVSHEHWPVKSEFVEKFGETETLTETCQCGSTRVVHYTHDPKIIWLSATTMTTKTHVEYSHWECAKTGYPEIFLIDKCR